VDKELQSLARDILAFWFGAPDEAGQDEPRETWWLKDPALDAEIRARFLGPYQGAAAGEFDAMAQTAEGALALILLLDQFSRNMFRDEPACYASDEAARKVAHLALDLGFDQAVSPVRRWFFYLPFEHSESLADQDLSLSLFEALPESPQRDETIASASRHREIVAQFGRFPHRNEILGRATTAEEAAFLRQPNSSF
jgi:uncharacterized protein (DUF924 family)